MSKIAHYLRCTLALINEEVLRAHRSRRKVRVFLNLKFSIRLQRVSFRLLKVKSFLRGPSDHRDRYEMGFRPEIVLMSFPYVRLHQNRRRQVPFLLRVRTNDEMDQPGWLEFAMFFFIWQNAYVVPSFARQTGLSCNVCHSNPPELTAFGRNFKLKGYVLADTTATDKVGNTKDLLLSRYIPLSVMIPAVEYLVPEDTARHAEQQRGLPPAIESLPAGGYASHFGGLAQITYTHADDKFSMDNTDLRYANQGKLGGKDWDYGITVNNNPTVEDPWNSTPAWGFPWISSEAGVSPLAGPIIQGALGQDVAGVGAFSMWNNHLYTDVTAYRSEHAGSPPPVTGISQAYNISGVAPYWRAAWQQNWGSNYLEFGTFGIFMNSFPGAVSGPEDRYVDPSIDFQYERPFGANLLDAHGAYTYEKSNLGATFLAQGATTAANHLNSLKFDGTYHWTNKLTATGALLLHHRHHRSAGSTRLRPSPAATMAAPTPGAIPRSSHSGPCRISISA